MQFFSTKTTCVQVQGFEIMQIFFAHDSGVLKHHTVTQSTLHLESKVLTKSFGIESTDQAHLELRVGSLLRMTALHVFGIFSLNSNLHLM